MATVQPQPIPVQRSAALSSEALIGLPAAGSDADGAFAAILGAISGEGSPEIESDSSKSDAAAGASAGDSGNMLPAVPAVPVVPAWVPMPGTRVGGIASEADLEDFAVGIGIDRGLARFLLATTGPDQGPWVAPSALGTGPGNEASFPAVTAIRSDAPSRMPLATEPAVGQPPQGALSGAPGYALGDEAILTWREISATDTSVGTTMGPEARASWASVRALLSPDPAVLPPKVELAVPEASFGIQSKLALQSVLPLNEMAEAPARTAGASAASMTGAELPALGRVSAQYFRQAQDAALRAARAVNPLPPDGGDSIGGPPATGLAAETGPAVVASSIGPAESTTSLTPVAVPDEGGVQDPPIESKDVGVAKELETAAAVSQVRPGDGLKESEGSAFISALEIPAAASGLKDRKRATGTVPSNEIGRIAEGIGPRGESGERVGGLAVGLQPGQERLPQSQPPDPNAAAQKLRLPDPTATHEARAQEFAAAVARRVIGQVRSEDWSVKLALDPEGLGELKLELALKGGAISGLVSVANQEARGLLEAGLPALKTELEAQGFSMGGWSFGQSAADQAKNQARNSRGKPDLGTLATNPAAAAALAVGDIADLTVPSPRGSGIDLYI